LRFSHSYGLCFGFGSRFRYSGALVAALAQRAKLTLCRTRCAQVTYVRRQPSILLFRFPLGLCSIALIRSDPIRSHLILFDSCRRSIWSTHMFCFRSDKIRPEFVAVAFAARATCRPLHSQRAGWESSRGARKSRRPRPLFEAHRSGGSASLFCHVCAVITWIGVTPSLISLYTSKIKLLGKQD